MRLPSAPKPSFALPLAASLMLAGCDPVINIAGANFPSWLFCAICGAVLTAMIRPVFVVTRLEAHLWPLAIVYSSLAVLMGCIVWIMFFNRV